MLEISRIYKGNRKIKQTPNEYECAKDVVLTEQGSNGLPVRQPPGM